MHFRKKYLLMSADDGNGGGGGSVTPPANPADDGNDAFKKIKTEKENWKKAAEEAKAKADAIEAKLKEKEEAELKTSQKFKELAELKEAQAADLKKQLEELTNKINEKENLIKTTQKRGAVKKELMANGVDEASMDVVMKLVDLEEVKFDEDAQAFYGVDGVIKKLKESLPVVFGAKKEIPGGDSPNGTTDSLSAENFSKLTLKEMKEKQFELMKSHGVQLRK